MLSAFCKFSKIAFIPLTEEHISGEKTIAKFVIQKMQTSFAWIDGRFSIQVSVRNCECSLENQTNSGFSVGRAASLGSRQKQGTFRSILKCRPCQRIPRPSRDFTFFEKASTIQKLS